MKQFPCALAKMAQALSEEEFHRMQVAPFFMNSSVLSVYVSSCLCLKKIKDKIISVQSGSILLTAAVVIEGGVILLASVSFSANNLTLQTI